MRRRRAGCKAVPCEEDAALCAENHLGAQAGDPEFWAFHTPYQYTEEQLKAGM